MTAPAKCRIDGIIAQEANSAVIFRRGPTRHVQQLVWDFNTDEVIPGQWIVARVYTRRSDVSPDGKRLVIAASDYSGAQSRGILWNKTPHPFGRGGWTAVSRPPFFSALAIWFSVGSWNGGGIWKSRDSLGLNPSVHGWGDGNTSPLPIEVHPLGFPSSEDEPIFTYRLRAHGWEVRQEEVTNLLNPDWREEAQMQMASIQSMLAGDLDPMRALSQMNEWKAPYPQYETVEPGLMENSFSKGRLQREIWQGREVWSVLDDSGRERKKWNQGLFETQWVDIDASERVVFADGGCLWAWKDFPDGEPTMIADLNPNRFEPVAPPDWALKW